jgi:CRISPR-associated protein Csm4
MPVLSPYLLTFQGGLRVGTRGVNLEEAGLPLPSDTLFSALMDACRRSGEEVASWLAPFLDCDPPFLLSSAFPFAGQVLFFPMPVDAARLFSPGLLASRGKEVKNIAYLSLGLLQKALSGETMDAWLFPEEESEEPARGVSMQGGELWLSVDEIPLLPEPFRLREGRRRALHARSLWARTQVPRVTVDRVGSASTPFHSGRISFASGCGLWFGVCWREKNGAAKETFARLLRLISEDGLGGERSAGYGAFDFSPGKPISLPDAGKRRPAYLLSRYHPREAELPGALASPGTAYHLTAVGGWLRSPDGPARRRKRVHLVEEGSLVRFETTWAGDLADVTPEYPELEGELPHRIYRSGLGLAAGWTEKEAGRA